MELEYSYSDGSGNTYIIKSERINTLEYIPVKPKYSSRGIYDGGDPAFKEINDTQYKLIISALIEGINNKKCHLDNRIKTSGMITQKREELEEVIILNPNSKELKRIETLLQEIIKE